MKPLLLFIYLSYFLSLKGSQIDPLKKEKYLNFIAAIENGSTYSYFTVIKVKDLNTGQVKEICTKGNFVVGALDRELSKDTGSKDEPDVLAFAKNHSDLYFEFKNKKALENISFYDYDPNQLSKIRSDYDFNKVVEIIKKQKKFSIRLNDQDMKLFAHILFNKGYMTGESDCFGGALDYVDRNHKE